MRMLLVSCFILLFSLPLAVLANVEKTIFLGPPAITIPTPHPNLDDLYLIPISPLHPTVRTRLNASFPTNGASKGTATWVLLDGLTPGARYEVRICWLATVGIRPVYAKVLKLILQSNLPRSLFIHTLSRRLSISQSFFSHSVPTLMLAKRSSMISKSSNLLQGE